MEEIAGGDLVPIQQVAAVAGVSSRTLRYYDDIGLLPPAATGDGGVRMYGQDELLRLQRILLMRELDLGLTAIREVLDERTPQVEALREHRLQVIDKREQLDRLVATLDRTVAALEQGSDMNSAEIFEGFDAAKQAEHEAELVERYGPQVQTNIDESRRRVNTMTRDRAIEISNGFASVEVALTQLLQMGAGADDERVQALIAQHYAVVAHFWTPDAQTYAGLGQMYVDSPDFRARYDSYDPGLAEYMRDAMDAYARAVLATD